MSAGRRIRAPMVLGVLIGFGVLCLAAASGPSTAFIVPQSDLPTAEPETESARGRELSGWDFWTGVGDARVMETWFAVVLAVVITVLIVVALVLLVRSVVAANRLRRERLEEGPDVPSRRWNRVQATAEVGAATDRAIQQLDSGAAADAITTYWQAVQTAGAEAGLPREAWQTSSEYSARLVTELGVTPQAIDVVAELFREVRFSQHPLEPESIELARSALTLIRAELPAAASAEAAP